MRSPAVVRARARLLVLSLFVVASSFVLVPAARGVGGPPDQVVLTVGSDASTRNVSWFSAVPAGQVVQIAPYIGQTEFPTDVRTIAESEAGPSADGRYYHHATITGLEPGTSYIYRVGGPADDWSPSYVVNVAASASFTFLLFGDPQLYAATTTVDPSAGWTATLSAATARVPNAAFMMTAGDHVNATTEAGQVGEWPLLLGPEQIARYPLAPTPGNHDNAGRLYGQHFALPNRSTAGQTIPGSGDYWFRYGSTLVVSINTNSLDMAAHQSFLASALAANPGTRWQIALFHHGPYSAGPHRLDGAVVSVRRNLGPILSGFGFDLALSGHDHAYTRSYLVNGTAVSTSGGSVVDAGPGDVLYLTANSASGSKYYSTASPLPAYAAVARQDRAPTYSTVQVSDGQLTITTYLSTGPVIDTVTLRPKQASNGFFLTNDNSGVADTVFEYGRPDDTWLCGDWNGDGIDSFAIRRANQYHIRNSLSAGPADETITYGDPGDAVLVGDWDGDGVDTLIVRRGSQFFVRNSLTSGVADSVFVYGDPGDIVLVGDWDGDGRDSLMVRRGTTFYVRNSLTSGIAETVFGYGNPGDVILVGDFDADGRDTLAVRRGITFYVRNSTTSGVADEVFAYGEPTDQAVFGDWNADGRDTIGIRR